MSRQAIPENHAQCSALRPVSLMLCVLISAIGCAPPATIMYAPSGLSSGVQDLEGKTIVVLGFQDLTENGQEDPAQVGKFGTFSSFSIRAIETITETVTSAVSSELQSRGFNVETFGSQTGVREEALVDLLTSYKAQATHPISSVVWGKIHRFYYRGGTWATARVDIELIALSPDTREILYSTKQSCTKSSIGLRVMTETLMGLAPVILLRIGHIERDFAVSLLSACLEETVQKGVGSEEMMRMLRGAGGAPT